MPQDLMSIDATINQVMESWPLQLSLKTPMGDEQVALEENTIVQRDGTDIDPGELQPGQHVRVTIRTTDGDRLVTKIEIID